MLLFEPPSPVTRMINLTLMNMPEKETGGQRTDCGGQPCAPVSSDTVRPARLGRGTGAGRGSMLVLFIETSRWGLSREDDPAVSSVTPHLKRLVTDLSQSYDRSETGTSRRRGVRIVDMSS